MWRRGASRETLYYPPQRLEYNPDEISESNADLDGERRERTATSQQAEFLDKNGRGFSLELELTARRTKNRTGLAPGFKDSSATRT